MSEDDQHIRDLLITGATSADASPPDTRELMQAGKHQRRNRRIGQVAATTTMVAIVAVLLGITLFNGASQPTNHQVPVNRPGFAGRFCSHPAVAGASS